MDNFDINSLTLGELAQIEDISGRSVADFQDDSAPKGRLLIAMALVAKRRRNTDFTLADAENLTMPQLQEIMGGGITPITPQLGTVIDQPHVEPPLVTRDAFGQDADPKGA